MSHMLRHFVTVSHGPGTRPLRSLGGAPASLQPRKMACINMRQRRYFGIGVENDQISVDWPEKYEVNFSLRPNAGRTSRVSPAGIKNRRRAYIYNRTVDSAFSETR